MNSATDILAAPSDFAPLKWWGIRRLEEQGCTASDWQRVLFPADIAGLPAINGLLQSIRNVGFLGDVKIGNIKSLHNCVIENSVIEDDAVIENVPGGVRSATIRRGACISNTARVEFEPDAPCGVGLEISVLDESGSRPVIIYPGLSAQIASLQARLPKWMDSHFREIAAQHIAGLRIRHEIGENARIIDSGPLINVFVDHEVKITNASFLRNGSVINNAASNRALASVGAGVDADGFIFEDAVVSGKAIIRNCHVGQGAVVDKGFTAHDSLFFANSALENGEACAFFAGPYTVSMHKASLLIGCQTSFMNAGSATNQSNHMYKLGPVHWGVLERGVKTSSNSYLMLGARIGAFSLLMGSHKTHPDSAAFPFSYLFGDERGATVVVPAQMLRSCGLMRDEKKWPTRDRRLKRRLPLLDRINFQILSPFTVERMLNALPVIDSLLERDADDDRFVRWHGMKFSRASLERAKHLYTIAVYKYLAQANVDFSTAATDKETVFTGYNKNEQWLDLCGQLLRRDILPQILEADSINEMEKRLTEAYENFPAFEQQWIFSTFGPEWHKSPDLIREYASQFDAQVDADRTDYLAQLDAENEMLAL